MALELTSAGFARGEPIPVAHTCDGHDTHPPLAWTGVPATAKSLALIVDDPDAPDPDAPTHTFVHWVLYDIPAATTGLPATESVSAGRARDGVNDRKQRGYTGPCPPVGRHRYFFKLYALDTILGDLHGPTKAQLEDAMRGHVIEHAELVGTYARAKAGAK
jgi:Raf kinase inhibitor-like YbhB/YbcL family protein